MTAYLVMPDHQFSVLEVGNLGAGEMEQEEGKERGS